MEENGRNPLCHNKRKYFVKQIVLEFCWRNGEPQGLVFGIKTTQKTYKAFLCVLINECFSASVTWQQIVVDK